MGCLSVCFRAKAKQSRNHPSLSQPSTRGNDSKNRLSDLFLTEEKAASSPCHDRDSSGFDSIRIHKDLKDEAQFLKSCGTTPATPIGISKASGKLETPQRVKRFTSSQFHLDEKTDEHCGEVSEQTPSSCITDSQTSAKISIGYSDAGEESQESIGTAFMDGVDRTSKVQLTAGDITGKRKSERFECDFDQSYSSSSSKNSTSKIPEKAGKSNFSATSRNLTPLKLSDKLQTPETIFPANIESEVRGRPRISSQFVLSASNLIENTSMCKLHEDSDESLEQTKLQACKEENESPTSEIFEGKLEQNSDEIYQIGEASISPAAKQSEENSNTNMSALSTITSGDRPIIGMVAVHWNEKEQSQISPKWWDGNGIPNSTNKYKEDQKVSWHATSFEERLEKALSEEGGQGFIPSRKFETMEETEKDTAISQLHHSAQSTSIVSF